MEIVKIILIVCLSLFVVALTAAVIYFIFILKEVGQTLTLANKLVNDAREKINGLTVLLDMVSTFAGGVEKAKTKIKKKIVKEFIPSKEAVIGFFEGLKKGLKVLFGGEKE